VATLFPNVSDAPVRLQGKALNHVFERPSEIMNSIQKYYVNEVSKGPEWLGSLVVGIFSSRVPFKDFEADLQDHWFC